MKTPIQELIEQMSYNRDRALGAEKDAYNICILYAENMLEKEKEVMCEFAFNYGDEINDQNNWRSPRNRTNYEVIQDCYNETFNSKEK